MGVVAAYRLDILAVIWRGIEQCVVMVLRGKLCLEWLSSKYSMRDLIDIIDLVGLDETTYTLSPAILSGMIRITVKEWIVDDIVSSAEDISNGHCGDFADCIWRKLGCAPDTMLYFSSIYSNRQGWLQGHTWLTHMGKHYDAECPDGVGDWRQMPFWQRDAQRGVDSILKQPVVEIDIG